MKKRIRASVAGGLLAVWAGYAVAEADGTGSRSAPGANGAARLPAPGTTETELGKLGT